MHLTYQDKLRSREWQKKKNRILERDNYKCQNPCCPKDHHEPLHVHHFYYLNKDLDPWEYDDSCLVTLCEYCHYRERERPSVEVRLFNTFRMKGFLISDLLAMSCKLEEEPNYIRKLLTALRKYQDG